MKHNLINKQTKEETLCNKVTIDGFDYYVSDKKIKENDWYYWTVTHTIQKALKDSLGRLPDFKDGSRKVIATNNPNIDIPKVVDEVEELAHKYFAQERFNWEQENPNGLKFPQPLVEQYNKTFTPLYKAGYNKSQETHPFSEEDMIEFGEIVAWNMVGKTITESFVREISKELLQLWKEQRPKTLYYE